jgi:hypothetical protein
MTTKEFLSTLTKNQKRYLSRFGCALCEMPLNSPDCGARYEIECTHEKRIKRAKICLENYKPRVRKEGGK